jgi:hypothetical protein
MRNKIIKIFTFLGGIYFFLEFLLSKEIIESIGVDKYHENITNGFVLIGTMAFGLGIINLLTIHGSKIIFKRKGWFNSAGLIFGLVLTTFVGLNQWKDELAIQNKAKNISNLVLFAKEIEKNNLNDKKNLILSEVNKASSLINDDLKILNEKYDDETNNQAVIAQIKLTKEALGSINNSHKLYADNITNNDELYKNVNTALLDLSVAYSELLRKDLNQSLNNRLWDYLFNGLFVALGSAMFSLLGLYIAAAAYRAFRIKTLESALMMLAAITVMLGQIPFGVWLYEDLPAIRLWLMEVPSSGAFRAIKIGSATAALVMAIRMWLSIESDFSAKKNV